MDVLRVTFSDRDQVSMETVYRSKSERCAYEGIALSETIVIFWGMTGHGQADEWIFHVVQLDTGRRASFTTTVDLVRQPIQPYTGRRLTPINMQVTDDEYTALLLDGCFVVIMQTDYSLTFIMYSDIAQLLDLNAGRGGRVAPDVVRICIYDESSQMVGFEDSSGWSHDIQTNTPSIQNSTHCSLLVWVQSQSKGRYCTAQVFNITELMEWLRTPGDPAPLPFMTSRTIYELPNAPFYLGHPRSSLGTCGRRLVWTEPGGSPSQGPKPYILSTLPLPLAENPAKEEPTTLYLRNLEVPIPVKAIRSLASSDEAGFLALVTETYPYRMHLLYY